MQHKEGRELEEKHGLLALEQMKSLTAKTAAAAAPQGRRQDAVDNFRAGKSWVLIAMEVLTPGMGFKGLFGQGPEGFFL